MSFDLGNLTVDEIYHRLNSGLIERINGLNRRIAQLDAQIRASDRILNGIRGDEERDGYESSSESSSGIEVTTRSSEYEREDFPSSSDDETVAYDAYYDPVEVDSDSDDDTETVVEEWHDPFVTPIRRESTLGHWYMADMSDIETGLEFLDNL